MRRAYGRIIPGSVAKRKTELCYIKPHSSSPWAFKPLPGEFWVEKEGLREGSSPVSLPLSPCLSFSTDCQGWSLKVTYLPPDFFQQFLTGCSDMCLSALITCDTGLAWMLTKFKSTIIKQRGNRKAAKQEAWAEGETDLYTSLPSSSTTPWYSCSSMQVDLKIAGLSSLCRTAQSAVPVEAPPLSHSFLLSVELQDRHAEPPISTPLPFLNPSYLVTGKDHLESSREASLESEPWNWQCSICFRMDSPRKSYFSTLNWYKIWGLVLIRQKAQNLLSTHFPENKCVFQKHTLFYSHLAGTFSAKITGYSKHINGGPLLHCIAALKRWDDVSEVKWTSVVQ